MQTTSFYKLVVLVLNAKPKRRTLSASCCIVHAGHAAPRAEMISDLSCIMSNPVDKFLTNTTKTQKEAATIMIRGTKSEALDIREFTIVSKFNKATERFL